MMFVLPSMVVAKDILQEIIDIACVGDSRLSADGTTFLVLGVLVGALLLVAIVDRGIEAIGESAPDVPVEVSPEHESVGFLVGGVVGIVPERTPLAIRQEGEHVAIGIVSTKERGLGKHLSKIGVLGLLIAMDIVGLETERNALAEFLREIEAGVVALVVGRGDHTFLIEIAECGRHLRAVVAGADTDVVFLLESRVNHEVFPVGILLIYKVLVHIAEERGIVLIGAGGGFGSGVIDEGSVGLPLELRPFGAGVEVEIALDHLRTSVGIDVHGGLALCPLFGGNEDDTVASTRTIDSLCGSVFEHLDRLDVLGVEIVDIIHRCSVHDIERSVAAREGFLTTDDDVGLPARACAVLGNDHACSLPAQHLSDTACGDGVDIICLDGSDGAGKVGAFLRAIADYDYLIERLGILLQNDSQRGA